MAMATEWVAPGQGTEAGLLWDLVVNSVAFKEADQEVRKNFLNRGTLSPVERRRKTRLQYRFYEDDGYIITGYDVERVIAAVWEYDQPTVICPRCGENRIEPDMDECRDCYHKRESKDARNDSGV